MVLRGMSGPRRRPAWGSRSGLLAADLAIWPARVPHPLRVFSCAREKAVIRWRRVVAGCRCSYGDAADRQRDRANKGLALWVCLLWNFGGYWPLVKFDRISR